MAGLGIGRPWVVLAPEAIDALPAQLGVYEIGDDAGSVVRIGFAGGRSPFGMRSALDGELEAGIGTRFRHEFTHGYLTRFEELLMVYVAQHGAVPPGNADHHGPIGRLHVAPVTGNQGS